MLKTLLGLVATAFMKKMVVASVVSVVALVAAGTVYADCLNQSRSDQGNAMILANSSDHAAACFYAAVTPCAPFLTVNQLLLVEFEMPDGSFPTLGAALCDPGARWLVSEIDKVAGALGIDLTLVNGGMALQSGGQLNASNPRVQQNFDNGKGIDLLRTNEALANFIGGHVEAARAVPCSP